MIIIIHYQSMSQGGNDVGDYDSPTSRDETPDNERVKKKKAKKKKKREKRKKRKKEKKIKKEREGALLLSFTTLVLQSSTMFFI